MDSKTLGGEMTEHDELLEALRNPSTDSEDDSGASTTAELAERLKMSENSVRKRIKRLTVQGKVKSMRVPRRNINGQIQQVWGYIKAQTDGEKDQ